MGLFSNPKSLFRFAVASVVTAAILGLVCLIWVAQDRSKLEFGSQDEVVLRLMTEAKDVAFIRDLTAHRAPELVDPERALPSSSFDFEQSKKFRRAEKTCQTGPIKSEWNHKWYKFIQILCAGSSFDMSLLLGDSIHPLGGSWARYIQLHGLKKWLDKPEVIKNISISLHLLELPLVRIGSIEMSPNDISPAGWADLVQASTQTKLVLGSEFGMLGASEKLSIYPLQDLRAKASDLGWNLKSMCVGLECLQKQAMSPPSPFFFYSLYLVFGLFLFSLIAFWRHRVAFENHLKRDQELVMQTLAHELRHPAASLQMSLEVFRDQYDALPENSQIEFLRMLDQMQRLRRVLDASRQYLQASANESAFQFQVQKISNVKSHIELMLEPYQGKLQLEFKSELPSLSIDKYWFGICVLNLVKNALIHGTQPIRLVVDANASNLMLTIYDSGPVPALSFQDMIIPLKKGDNSPGMGLGLSLVYRLAELMGGSLSFSESPKYFRLQFPIEGSK